MTEAEKKRYDEFRAKQAAKRIEEWRHMWRRRMPIMTYRFGTVYIEVLGMVWNEI